MQLICLIMNTTDDNNSLYRKRAIYKYRKDNHWDRLDLTCTTEKNSQEYSLAFSHLQESAINQWDARILISRSQWPDCQPIRTPDCQATTLWWELTRSAWHTFVTAINQWEARLANHTSFYTNRGMCWLRNTQRERTTGKCFSYWNNNTNIANTFFSTVNNEENTLSWGQRSVYNSSLQQLNCTLKPSSCINLNRNHSKHSHSFALTHAHSHTSKLCCI